MKLTERIAALDLAPPARSRFRAELLVVARADGQLTGEEEKLVDRLVPPSGSDAPAEIDALWRCRELLTEAAIYVSVADGEYRVEEPRAVSELPHRLGLSARLLGEIEARTFAELRRRVAAGAELTEDEAGAAAADGI